jgi:hypothetical protein
MSEIDLDALIREITNKLNFPIGSDMEKEYNRKMVKIEDMEKEEEQNYDNARNSTNVTNINNLKEQKKLKSLEL